MGIFRLFDELAEHVSLRLNNAVLRAVDYYDELEKEKRPH